MTAHRLNKYTTNEIELLEFVDRGSSKNFFESHKLATILEESLPFITQSSHYGIPDTLAYLVFLQQHSNENRLQISKDWFNQRSTLSLSLHENIINWLETNESYVLPDGTSITTFKITSDAQHEILKCCSERSKWKKAAYLFAAAKILQREIYVVLFNGSNKNVLHFKHQSHDNPNPCSPFIIGLQSNGIFLPLLEKNNKIRSLGALVTDHVRQLHGASQTVNNSNILLTSTTIDNELYQITEAHIESVDYNATRIDVKLIWLHSTAPHLIQKTLKTVELLDWDIANKYNNSVTKKAKECIKLLLDNVYQPLQNQAKALLVETQDHLIEISARRDKLEQDQGAQDYYEEYMRHDSDIDESEDTGELVNDDQSDDSDDQPKPGNSYSLDTLEDDEKSVTETKHGIKSVIKDFGRAIKDQRLLPSTDLDDLCESIDEASNKVSEHDNRIRKYPDDDDDDDQFAKGSPANSEHEIDTITERNFISLDSILETENIVKIIEKNIDETNKKLAQYESYMADNKNDLINKEHRKMVLIINKYVLQYGHTKRCPSLYFIYAGFELLYIGLTTTMVSRFSSGHSAFTKLLNPIYCHQPFRICFFALDINGIAIESSDSSTSPNMIQSTIASNSKKRPKTNEEQLLICIEQLLINHFKPKLNTQGIHNLHGEKNFTDFIQRIRIQIPLIFLSPYPEFIKNGIQDIITIERK
ncbi:unnamed protein product [Rotaria socialis]|uniref:Uncharacterized protein n=1 Tax=Rotaria socialis TaxID=392032 RepID=A0A818APP9_9BILA|nr:unnamed protein product [Rotaria socialis]CAF3383607.1 unnamed protein product [Rotaria socialis]CAF3408732.1 unnamed protein product [Rotaria socialis]CAF3774764.1 unnamed protein product [Rotaria socialis]CAF4564643.1 unnamed protein product [Rotaria socialis]